MTNFACNKQKQPVENAVQVKTITVSPSSLNNAESYSGTQEEDNGISLSFPVGGTVRQVNIAEGQNVQARQLIAVLDATTLNNLVSASSATVNQAEAAVKTAHAQKNISLKNLHDTRLFAPSTGYISRSMVTAGQNIAPGQPVAMLVDIRHCGFGKGFMCSFNFQE